MSIVKQLWYRSRNFCSYVSMFGFRGACQAVRSQRAVEPLVTIRVSGIKTPIYFRPRTSDFQILQSILGRKEGLIRPLAAPKLIVDAGANIGLASLWYASTYPEAHVVAVEPDPANFEVLRRNCAGHTNITPVEAALWPTKQTLFLTNPTDQPWTVQVTDRPDGSAGVPTVTVPELLRQAGGGPIDLLKIDIEGSERELLLGAVEEWLPKVGVLVVELHDRFKPGCSDALEQALRGTRHHRSRSGEYDVVVFDRAGGA